MSTRVAELQTAHAAEVAKPSALGREIAALASAQGELANAVQATEAELFAAKAIAATAERDLADVDEAFSSARENRATLLTWAELAEAVYRLRGSIAILNREGRGRLREAFTTVDHHFRHLSIRLLRDGQAHLALIDRDDPSEAGLEIFTQPPGNRLQSLTLLSGGEQA